MIQYTMAHSSSYADNVELDLHALVGISVFLRDAHRMREGAHIFGEGFGLFMGGGIHLPVAGDGILAITTPKAQRNACSDTPKRALTCKQRFTIRLAWTKLWKTRERRRGWW